jgi:hypothetical protein
MKMETLTLRSLRARPVLLPLKRPVAARIATIDVWPMILIDLQTEEGVVGRAYLEPYVPKAMKYLIAALHDFGEMLAGQRLAPVEFHQAARRSLHFVGYAGLSMIAASGLDMAAWDALARAADLAGGLQGPKATPPERPSSPDPRPLSRLGSIRCRRQLPQLLLEQVEIDRLGHELECPEIAGAAPPLVIAIGGHHHHRQIGEPLFDLAQQLQTVHSRHVDVRQDDDQLRFDPFMQQTQRLFARAGEVHHIGALARLAAKALAEKISDIRLVIDHKDADTHVNLPNVRRLAIGVAGGC